MLAAAPFTSPLIGAIAHSATGVATGADRPPDLDARQALGTPRSSQPTRSVGANSARGQASSPGGSPGSTIVNAAPLSRTAGSRTRSPSIARHSSRETYSPRPLP